MAATVAGARDRGKRSFLWVPADATVSDLIACYLAERDRVGARPPRPIEIARALGIGRRSVDRFDGRTLTYCSTWRPILRELLPVAVPVAAKILATHIDRRDGAAYVPTQHDYAADLGWSRRAVQRMLARLTSAGLLQTTEENRRGCSYRQRRSIAPKRRPSSRQSDARHRAKATPVIAPKRRPEEVRTSTPHPSHSGAGWRPPAMDGWADLRSPEILAQLESGPHAPSLLAVLTVAGIFQRDRHGRAIFAAELAERGITTEQLVAAVLAAFDPAPHEGRVRSPGGLLRAWLERSEIPRAPVPVGQVLRQAAEQRRRADDALARAELRSRQSVARIRDELRAAAIVDRRLRGADDDVRALEVALARSGEPSREALGELYHLVYDRRAHLAELLEFASRFASEPVLEALPPRLSALALAEANRRRQTDEP